MEDPFHYVDTRGNWHVLSHQYSYPSFEVTSAFLSSLTPTCNHRIPCAAFLTERA
jgi:hypothetical protein